MVKIRNCIRAKKLIDEIIKKLDLDLSSMTVLTEAASGNFIVTPLIAAVAGADRVYAVCRDSKYGTAKEIQEYLHECMQLFHIPDEQICLIQEKESEAENVNIVTNLGFVRPIHAQFIEKLPFDAAIPLMFESWEFRRQDIDVTACDRHHTPILGTKETHPDLRIFTYVGMSVLKLLLENGIEVFKSRMLIISSGGYLKAIKNVLLQNGAEVVCYDPFGIYRPTEEVRTFLETCDAVIVAEQCYKGMLIGNESQHVSVRWLLNSMPLVVHIAGQVDDGLLKENQILKVPPEPVQHGYMTVTTEYVGIRPVIDLHAAGLKVGQAMVEGLRMFHNRDAAKQYALEHSPAMDFNICKEKG